MLEDIDHLLEVIASSAATLPAIRPKQRTIITFPEFELSIMQNWNLNLQETIPPRSNRF